MSQQPASVTHLLNFESQDDSMAEEQSFATSLADSLQLPPSSDGPPQLLLPVPTHSPKTKSLHIFSLSDLLDGTDSLETLGPEIAAADINIPIDGTFIESSSGPAIYELKRRYDQLAGVGSSVRTPYAITAFVSQHGKSMFRLGFRDETEAPGATAAAVEEKIIQSKTPSETSQSPGTKRRSRLSMHFLPPAMFNKGNTTTARPPTVTSSTIASRKLRKTRSIPDMSSTGEGDMPVGKAGSTFTVTGRAHSQSVTAVDPRHTTTFNVIPSGRKTDIFAELIACHTPSSTVASQFSTHTLLPEVAGLQQTRDEQNRPTVREPFGPGITFNSPSKSTVDRLPAPRHLREMQSFESGMTARQIEPRSSLASTDSTLLSDLTTLNQSRPPSALSMSLTSDSQTIFNVTETNGDTEPNLTPSPEAQRLTSAHTIEVFNVLQTYRGLPVFEKLVPDSEDVIKLSLAADQTAAPRDDPRFVIWGEVQSERDVDDYHSSSRDSLTDFSSSNPSSSISRRRSNRTSKLKTPEASSARIPPDEAEDRRVLLAATIERWIAQLTSYLDYDELLNFFLTYRNYVSAIDVCNILICRFHWALQKPSSKQDEAVRRIVRVRTFVAIRYWLLTFFPVDFIPNRELRLLIADWLNTLLHDPSLKTHVDGIGIVRRLVKVAKNCKRLNTRAVDKPKTPPQPKAVPDTQEGPEAHLLGKSFAQATKKLVVEADDSDLDLDFLPDDANLENPSSTDPVNAHLTVGNVIKGTLSPSRPTSIPLSSINTQRADHARGLHTEGGMSFVQHPSQLVLPIRHSSLSRAFVKTIGRIGRWKRVLNPRYSMRPTSLGACGTVSAFDLEVSAARDLLATHGGVEEYLMMAGPASSGRSVQQTVLLPQPQVPSAPVLPPMSIIPPLAVSNTSSVSGGHDHPVPPSSARNSSSVAPEVILPPVVEQSEATLPKPQSAFDALDILEPSEQDDVRVTLDSSDNHGSRNTLAVPERAESFRSSSTDSFGVPLTSGGPLQPSFPGSHSQWQFDVVSIDELDLSDTSSIPGRGGLDFPPGLRKPLKKLPLRRDFEFVRRSEVSSMGIISHESLRDSAGSSHSGTSPSSSPGRHPIRRWQMKTIQRTFDSSSNDSGDKGDVEDALRRLEGQINPKVLQERAEKVDGWVRAMQEQIVNGDYDERSIFSEEEVESFIDEDLLTPDADTRPEATLLPEGDNIPSDPDDAPPSANDFVPTQTHNFSSASETEESSLQSKASNPAPADVIPVLRGRISPTNGVGVEFIRPSIETVITSKFSTSEAPATHHSFLHNFPAEMLAEHFAMIDRELFIGVKFEELVSEQWMECEGIEVLDWAQFLKDRTRWKAELRFPERTTALAALWARFNLMVNFVVSEVLMTHPTGRPALVEKLIRVAWKSYSISNFNSLTAIIVALQNDWVVKAMRRPGWHRIGASETRMLRDLKKFTANTDDFKFMRNVVDSIVNAGSGTESQSGKSKAGSENQPATPSACIPFIGIYLTQLHRLNKLPAVIDPTAPHKLSALDVANSVFQSPLHPEVFSSLVPLPNSMSLEVLINVHKQRRIADVIKALVTGQHLASRVHFDVDKKLFQRCLRLVGLDTTDLQRALALYPD